MSSDPIFWVYAVIAVTLVGISKGGFGGGLGVVGVPLLAMTTSPATAAAILLPILIVMDFTGLHGWRGRWDREQLGRLIPAALIGIVFGALSFHLFSDDGIRILIGIIGIDGRIRRSECIKSTSSEALTSQSEEHVGGIA